tara:strand:- start:650 stop:961 length:312 start_codon:yes stop_codon:yes gene_type:complete
MADIDYIKVIKDVFKKEKEEGKKDVKIIADLFRKLADTGKAIGDINTIKYTKQAINKQKRTKSRLSQRTGNQYTGDYPKAEPPVKRKYYKKPHPKKRVSKGVS